MEGKIETFKNLIWDAFVNSMAKAMAENLPRISKLTIQVGMHDYFITSLRAYVDESDLHARRIWNILLHDRQACMIGYLIAYTMRFLKVMFGTLRDNKDVTIEDLHDYGMLFLDQLDYAPFFNCTCRIGTIEAFLLKRTS